MAKRKWMTEAFANAHGQFKAKAKAAGKSTAAFAKEKASAPGKLGKQARLAEAGMKASRGSDDKGSRGERWYGSKKD